MAVETVDTLVIGGGQAGLAMSAHLGRRGMDHLVVERHRIAERWRTERWDSLVANGPAWHDRFPAMTFDDMDPDAFAPKDRIVRYFETLAEREKMPVRCGVEVRQLVQRPEGGFRATLADGGVIEARNVVAATGPFQKPVFPAMIPDSAGVMQIHSNHYRNPGQLPEGAVLVVGAGSSGAQIADELLRSGREVYLSVGPHDRPPRAYRGRDFVWWLGALGKWDARAVEPGMEHVTIAVSGAEGGQTVDFRNLGNRGMKLVGRTDRCEGGVLHFAPDLAANIARGDANYLSVLDEADAHVAREGLDLPEEPEARVFEPVPDCVTDPILSLDLKAAGVGAVIWATGYVLDFGWIGIDVFDDKGRPRHDKGISEVPGLYFLGLPWLSRRASPFIWGVWHDADHLAGHIAGRG
ncbi:NAD(P)-binding domain-containing protein [Rhodobacter sp. HX-7-19]|uniref:NAD(P)-binding domain-containing protein n=2 Tax=Pseudomonadota TaxID=1224 RepID=A0A6M1TXS9_9RHOB|nr:NAD(P)/FAD-dependent oxidoreductase [Rhodobacter kunshanensis]NGQ91606.1 NAD(P)-binding domain-containing protein [Rhodobacter kunshanensis]